MEFKIANLNNIQGVLDLQERFLFKNLSLEQRKEGFVTTPFTLEQLEKIIGLKGLFVALEAGKVVGYIFAGNWEYFKQWEIFKYMISRFPKLNFKGQEITTLNSFQYGPVCIEKAYRGGETFKLLFQKMQSEMSKKYPISYTFINKINTRSTKAHTQKIGWEIIDDFEFNDNQYFGLAFDMNHKIG